MSEFEKWWYDAPPIDHDNFYDECKAAFAAGQAASAARIAELEAALENVSEDCCIKRKRITELESDARIMAEALIDCKAFGAVLIIAAKYK